MKNVLVATLILFVVPFAKAQISILPTPSYHKLTKEKSVFNKQIITVEKGVLETSELNYFSSQLLVNGFSLVESEEKPDIYFSYRKHLLPEAYGIQVDERIEIAFNQPAGRFYGLVSLLQLFEFTDTGAAILPKGIIEDAPKFEWRGLHLDVSRHFFTVEEIERFLDLMALYKFNTFHWHLTDDQGWRIEIKQYPKLTTVGGYRDSTVIGHYTDSPRQYNKERYGGFYSQEDITRIVEYAKTRHIDVVPEIEMPGHSRAALAAYPELSCTAKSQGVPGLWGVFDDIYCSRESSILFLQNVLDEVLALFPSEYIHIGGDEAPKTRWNECSDCQKVMEENGLLNTQELQSYFIKQMDTYLTKRGRKLIGWDEILEGGLSPNAAVMSWRGESGGVEAAKQGHYVVMSPTSYCYFDYYQSSHDSEPLAIGGFLPLEKVYEFNPVPKELTEAQAKYVLGGQANVWTEYIPSFEQVEYMVYPRAIALMQNLWCQKKPDYSSFLTTYLQHHEAFLRTRNVNFAKSIHIPELHVRRTERGVSYSWSGLDTTEYFDLADQFSAGGEEDVAGGLFKVASGEQVEFDRGDGRHHLMLEFNGGQQITYTVHKSDILGAKVDLVTPPHQKFNHNGSLNLVDGIYGDIPWKGDQWLGFNSEKVEIIVELDAIEQLKTLSIGFLDQNGSWIYLPESMSISTSADKENWLQIGATELTSEETVSRHEVKMNTYGKYVKIEVFPLEMIPEGKGGAGHTPWTFIDEIQIELE